MSCFVHSCVYSGKIAVCLFKEDLINLVGRLFLHMIMGFIEY